MITPFVVSKCANFQVKMFPNTHFFSKKHEFWRIYQCTDLAEKLQTSTLLLSKRTNRNVFNAIFKSFLRHIESTLCLFKVTNKIQKKINFFDFFCVIFIFFKRVRFPGEIFVFLQTSFETTDINFEYFLMVFGANES